jgi:LysW-gamma-L-lysine carboxypeptidase
MLEKALRLYTPSLSEKPMAEFLADKCDDLGFEDIQIDEVGNVIAIMVEVHQMQKHH